MKLYPILYTEAARTPEESLTKNVLAVKVYDNIVLFSKRRAIKALSKKEVPFAHDREDFFEWKGEVIKAFTNDAIVGVVSYRRPKIDLYQITSSAGVNRFGPLAYQLAMKTIDPAWLKSDKSLTEDSLFVWQKMYELSEQGVYQKKWLGEWGWESFIPDSVEAWVGATSNYDVQDYLEKYLEEVRTNKQPHDEAYFLEFIRKNSFLTPAMFGNFWAYQKTSHDSKIDEMFQQGESFIDEAKEKYNIRPGDLLDIIEEASGDFFNRRYR